MAEYLLTKLLYITGMCCLVSSHDTIPNTLWPLSNWTKGREVASLSGEEILFEKTEVFSAGEPRLGYTALDIDANSFRVVLGDDLQENFMLMAMFYLNPKKTFDVFKYDILDQEKFKLYIENCNVYVRGPSGSHPETIKNENCIPGWYTLVVRWKDHMKFMVIYSDQNEEKGKALLEGEAKDAFGFSVVPYPGNLTVGPITQGRICCLRIYREEFDKGHVEAQMLEDCEMKEYWKSEEPNPCASKPCQHGGTCEILSTGYSCKCRRWYSGVNCSKGLLVLYIYNSLKSPAP